MRALLDVPETGVDLDGDGNHELELLTNSYALVPPSIIEHQECRKTKEGCPSKGRDPYRLIDTHPDAHRMTEDNARNLLDRLGLDPDRVQNTTTSASDDSEPPDVDENLADIGETALRTLQEEHTRTFNSLLEYAAGRNWRIRGTALR
jgi:hypothetical protein